jgi:hypothetical protein
MFEKRRRERETTGKERGEGEKKRRKGGKEGALVLALGIRLCLAMGH